MTVNPLEVFLGFLLKTLESALDSFVYVLDLNTEEKKFVELLILHNNGEWLHVGHRRCMNQRISGVGEKVLVD